MSHQPINHGSAAGDGQGESLFDAFTKVNANDAELFGAKTVFVANYAALPVTGEVGKIYVTIDDDAMYRWTGTEYDDLGGIQFVANAAALPVTGEALKVYVALDTGRLYYWAGAAYVNLGGLQFAPDGTLIANVTPRSGTLTNLLTSVAGGVGEVSYATDWDAAVIHNGVVGGAKVLYCKPKRCTLTSTTDKTVGSSVMEVIHLSDVVEDPHNLYSAAIRGVLVPADATHFRVSMFASFAASATGRRVLRVGINNSTAGVGIGELPNQTVVSAAAATNVGTKTFDIPRAYAQAIVGNISSLNMNAYQDSGGALAISVGTTRPVFSVEFWREF